MTPIVCLQSLIVVFITLLTAGCANPTKTIDRFRDLLMRAEDSIDEAFALHGHYVVYTGRALYLLDDARIALEHKQQLQDALDGAQPFADPLILATLEIVEFKQYAKYDPETFNVLKHNLDFWIAHFEPHVEILINTVRGAQLRLNNLEHGHRLLAIG